MNRLWAGRQKLLLELAAPARKVVQRFETRQTVSHCSLDPPGFLRNRIAQVPKLSERLSLCCIGLEGAKQARDHSFKDCTENVGSVTFRVRIQKLQADRLGNEREIAFDDGTGCGIVFGQQFWQAARNDLLPGGGAPMRSFLLLLALELQQPIDTYFAECELSHNE